MNTFCGCDTDTMTDLSSMFGGQAAHLRSVMEAAASTVADVPWTGHDAEYFRERIGEIVEEAIGLFERLRRLGELLGEESEEQTTCSQPEGGGSWKESPRLMGAELPRRVDEFDLSPQLAGPGADGLRPMIGGPFAMKDPVSLADRLPPLPELWGPLIGGPFMARDPLRPIPAPHPIPEGEEFALDPEILAGAQEDRRILFSYLPFVGTAQKLMGIHDAAGRFYDTAEGHLEESGLEAATPLVSVARVPHTLAGLALGEKSVLGQTMDGIDRQLANVVQTTGEISSAIGDGDWGGAAGAAERGLFRHAGAGVDILTSSPAPAVAETVPELAGTVADVVEPLSPGAAAPLREVEQISQEAGDRLQSDLDRLTDAERYYDLRRQYVPLPWDPRE